MRASLNLSTTSSHISVYARTQPTNSSNKLMSDGYNLLMSLESGQFIGTLARTFATSVSQLATTGFYIVNRPDGNTLKLIRNSSILLTDSSSTSTNYPNFQNVFLSASTTIGPFSNAEIAFATIGDGLSDTESVDIYTIVQAFQTTLGRQV
jgi:hypothetical protein